MNKKKYFKMCLNPLQNIADSIFETKICTNRMKNITLGSISKAYILKVNGILSLTRKGIKEWQTRVKEV